MNKKQNSLMRFSRTERLAQLSEQEIVIEKKKREIQAKLEAQKKKQTEEALRKLESSRETKKPGFSNKSWSGSEDNKSSSKEKSFEEVKESLTNAFSNDGSFLDHFKKLSQTGLPGGKNMQTPSKTAEGSFRKSHEGIDKEASGMGRNTADRSHKFMNENIQSSITQNLSDSRAQLQISPPGIVHLLPQSQCSSVICSAVDNPASVVPSDSVVVPQFQGGIQNLIHAFNSNNKDSNFPGNMQPMPPVKLLQLNSTISTRQDSSVSEPGCNESSATTLASIQSPLPITPQNIPPPSPIQVQNIPPPPIPPNELPKLRSESISMTLKSNTAKKLEAIPNPLESDQPPSPPSPKRKHISFPGTKGSFFNTTPLVENDSSHDRESLRVSSAFNNNFEDGQEGDDILDKKCHHWAEVVARCGDNFEESLRKRNQNNADIRFLLDKDSEEYHSFRKLVSTYRRRLESSEEEPLDKARKLNPPPLHKGSTEEMICSNNDKQCGRSSNDEGNSCGKEYVGSERTASTLRQEGQTYSKFHENREDCLPQNLVSELTPREDCLLPSPKQFFSKDTLTENSKDQEQCKSEERPRRKRKSRWGDAVPTTSSLGTARNITLQPAGKLPTPKSTLLSQLTRSDPGLIQYARQTFGSTNLSEEDWKKAEDHYKINLLYQDMVKKRAEVEKLERQGKFKYEYDSDEDTEGGTWEHKLRQQEMQATQLWAEELTRQAAGKHHIGDFLPPEELERFMEKYNAVKEGREPDLSDYKEYKLKEDNVGYRLLQKMGWNEGQGLGQDGSGITNPVNKATTRHENQGLGIERPDGLGPGDDEYDAYRKRMMLAYRFRPNPLNNPRRPYY